MAKRPRFSKLNSIVAALAFLNLAQACALYSASRPKIPRNIPAAREMNRDGVEFFTQGRDQLYMQLVGVGGQRKTIYRLYYR